MPQQIFTDAGRAQLDTVKLSVPVGLVIAQLSTGKVAIKLDDLIPLFPANVLRSPLPPVSDQQSVVLPLHEVIAALPAELLATEHDSEISVNDPELASLPDLIDETVLHAAPPAPEETKTPEPAAVIVPPKPKSNGAPEYVMISLRSLVAVMPDNVFCCSRSQLAGRINVDSPILLPSEPIIPQLRGANVKLPLSIIVAMVPHQVLANPMPALDGLTVPLPLAEIIPQLPAAVFTEGLREPVPEVELAGEPIPDPFQEKGAVIETPAPEPELQPFTGEIAVNEAALADDTFSVFTERSPAPVVEPVAPEPEPEPAPQVTEPVAEAPAPVVEEVVPVEPVAEVVAPEPVVVPAPEVFAATPEPEVVQPVATPEPEVVEPVAEVTEPAVAELVAEVAAPEPVVETPTVDEKKLLVDLNRCSVEDLTTIDGIGRALAQRIIDFRNSRGKFNSVNELRQVPGIGRKTFRALAGVHPHALNRILGATDDGELTLQEIVRLTGKLPGIDGCMLATADGLFVTGELPPHLDQSTISVFAPQLFKKVGRYARELKVGSIRRFTIFTDTQPISIFRAGDVYLIVIHDAFRFSKALLRRCERISQEIARLSSQRVTV